MVCGAQRNSGRQHRAAKIALCRPGSWIGCLLKPNLTREGLCEHCATCPLFLTFSAWAISFAGTWNTHRKMKRETPESPFSMKSFRIVYWLLVLPLMAASGILQAQLVVDNSLSAEQLAESLVGDGVTVDNVVLNCPGGAFGSFVGIGSGLVVDSGVILTSGSIFNVFGSRFRRVPNIAFGPVIQNLIVGDPIGLISI